MNNTGIHLNLELTKEEAQKGCTRSVMVGNQRYNVYIPAKTKAGDRVEIRSNDGTSIIDIEIKRVIGEENKRGRKIPPHKQKLLFICLGLALIAVAAAILLFYMNNGDNKQIKQAQKLASAYKIAEKATLVEKIAEDAVPAETEPAEDDNNSGYSYEPAAVPDNKYGFIIGESYQVQTNLRVRAGAGKEYRILERTELTPEDYEISVNSKTTKDALIEKGKWVTCLGMQDNWMQISSGWICVFDDGEELVK
ncbi:MAG: hypothetical protein IKK28_12990 [Mogibacterium sp.]|nr:hypothetical protein [Mogibacterium sp.]